MNLNKTMSAFSKKVWGRSKDRKVTFEDISQEVLKHHPDADLDYLRAAHDFGEKAHEGQTRKSGEPYFNHPRTVGYMLAGYGLDLESVAAGFLHDVVEDCDVSLKDLARLFGKDLANIVDGVTKIGKVKFRDKTQAQAENYRKMILAMADDVRVLIVKLTDRCHNMKTLEHLQDEKRRRISQETLDIYAPLAHRIGMNQLKTELERLSFYFLEPEAYESLDRQMTERHRKNKRFLETITYDLKRILKEHDTPGEVSSRIKSPYSVYNKMKRKNRSLDGIYDYYAFRILTDTVENCYKIFGLLHGEWRHMPGRIKDFITAPKSNLYQSIHTTLINSKGVPFEVQIRTDFMHRLAEEGVAAHWTYKRGRLQSVGKNKMVSWLKRLADEQREVKDTDEFLENMKDQLNTEEILVFTPTGEIRTLPKGATPLDFAYHIHTDLGHTTVGAKVDGKMAPLKSKLQSGSIVEILTSPTQTPSREWLNIVKSPSSRSKIRAWLRKEERTKSVDLGRTMFENTLKKYKVPLKKINNNIIQSKLPELGYKKIEDFYAAIGFGKITPLRAVRPFLPEDTLETKTGEEVRESKLKRALQSLARKSRSQVLVKGHGDILVYLAKCCNPIVGDPIVGFISKGKGVSIHQKGCSNFARFNVNPERMIDVAWDSASVPENELFQVKLRAYTEERAGMIADISMAIAATNTNVQQLNAIVDSDHNTGIFDILVQIRSLDHLNKVIQSLKKVKGMLSVERL